MDFLPFLVLIPFVAAAVVAVAQPRLRAGAPLLAGIAALTILALLIPVAGPVHDGEVVRSFHEWLPQAGLAFSFRLDGLSLLFVLLIAGIGVLVILYAYYYLQGEEATPRFYAFLLIFMGSMLGLVLSENVLQMLLFWEMTGLASFLLIGFRRDQAEARRGARQALLVTGAGGLALLGALLWMGDIAGSYELTDIFAASEQIKSSEHYLPILVLFLLGAFTKSAQFPFHFWLPNAMAAPTPVSAYLHSATMVKAGVFLLGRFFPVLAGEEAWFYLVSGAGLTTLLVGAYLAVLQNDLKGLLAYSTISHLGLITLLFGLGTPLGEIAALFHIMNHALFKASLFMAAGIIEHETGTRDLRKLRGLYRYMPHTAVLAMVASGAMAGVPLLNGFLSKEMFFAETLHSEWLGSMSWLLPTAATLAGVLSVAYSLRFIVDVFFRSEPTDLPKAPHEPPRWMKVPVEVLVVACLAVGVVPEIMVRWLLDASALAVLQAALPEYSLAVWHGLGLPLLMSVVALGGGLILYRYRDAFARAHEAIPLSISGQTLLRHGLTAALRAGQWLDNLVGNASLARSAIAMLITTVAMVAMTQGAPVWSMDTGNTPLDIPTAILLVLLMATGVAVAVTHHRHLLTLAMLGVCGLMVSLLFARFSAPDLALTQLLVEIVTVILILLALYFLPETRHHSRSLGTRVVHMGIAGLCGFGVAALAYLAMTMDAPDISAYFLENAKRGGGGTNVVNVILVDFRALDTLGEVTVLGIAAVGIYSMLSGFRLNGPGSDGQGQPWSAEAFPVIPAVVTRMALPLALLVSAYLFLRGHNEPGGGFIAGLVTGSALILDYLSHGVRKARERMGWDQLGLIGLGVLIAVLTGVASFAFDHPFLTSTFGYVTWPIVGTFEIASALTFDLGVYLGVVGTVMVILTALGRLGNREHT
jgi:multicomponent K+:H+ antiporter subunit A